jgi:hypothetical protein
MRWRWVILATAALSCGRTALVDEPTGDAGARPPDAGHIDAGTDFDGGPSADSGTDDDAGTPDAGWDAGADDAGVPPSDAGRPDAGLARCEGRVTMAFEIEYLDLDDRRLAPAMGPLRLPPPGSDLKVAYGAQSMPHSLIQNVELAEIAILNNRTLDSITPADVATATFTLVTPSTPFSTTRVVLIRTPRGAVFALGNPAESMNISFDVRLIVGQCL